MKAHIEKAHEAWGQHVKPGDCVIDATCGNGHDTLVLAKLALTPTSGTLYACDIQPDAIKKTHERLQEALPEVMERIVFVSGCHSRFPLPDHEASTVVYNLGYLPGGDKTKTTLTISTLASILDAMRCLKPGGLISITLYPGHEEGKVEAEEVMKFVHSLDVKSWRCEIFEPKEKPTSPKLLLLRSII